MRDYSDILDENEIALKAKVETANEDWFHKVDVVPQFEIAYSWGAHEDLPLGLDLSEVS